MGVRGGFSGLVVAGLALSLGLFACGGAQPDDVIKSPPSKQEAVDEGVPVPLITVRHLTGCARQSAERVADGRSSNVFHYDLKLGAKGQVLDTKLRGMTSADAALEGCVREAIAAMVVPEGMRRSRSSRPLSGGERMTRERRGLLGSSDSENPLLLLGELVVESVGVDVIIEVGMGVIAAIGTIVVPKDPIDECTDHYAACMDTNFGNKDGDIRGTSRCAWCRRVCQKNKGLWPLQVGAGRDARSCKYPGWGSL